MDVFNSALRNPLPPSRRKYASAGSESAASETGSSPRSEEDSMAEPAAPPPAAHPDPKKSAPKKKNSRRKHRNSHLGCGICKKRRIKCDENLPQCFNCIKGKLRCAYLNLDAPARNALRMAQYNQNLREDVTVYDLPSPYDDGGGAKADGVPQPHVAYRPMPASPEGYPGYPHSGRMPVAGPPPGMDAAPMAPLAPARMVPMYGPPQQYLPANPPLAKVPMQMAMVVPPQMVYPNGHMPMHMHHNMGQVPMDAHQMYAYKPGDMGPGPYGYEHPPPHVMAPGPHGSPVPVQHPSFMAHAQAYGAAHATTTPGADPGSYPHTASNASPALQESPTEPALTTPRQPSTRAPSKSEPGTPADSLGPRTGDFALARSTGISPAAAGPHKGSAADAADRNVRLAPIRVKKDDDEHSLSESEAEKVPSIKMLLS